MLVSLWKEEVQSTWAVSLKCLGYVLDCLLAPKFVMILKVNVCKVQQVVLLVMVAEEVEEQWCSSEKHTHLESFVLFWWTVLGFIPAFFHLPVEAYVCFPCCFLTCRLHKSGFDSCFQVTFLFVPTFSKVHKQRTTNHRLLGGVVVKQHPCGLSFSEKRARRTRWGSAYAGSFSDETFLKLSWLTGFWRWL